MDWKGNAEGNNPTEALVNRLVSDKGYIQLVDSPTRGDAVLDVYLVRPEISFTTSSIMQGISVHHGGMLQVDWEGNSIVPQSVS